MTATSRLGGVMQLSERQVIGVSIIDLSGDPTAPDDNARALRENVTALLLRGQRRIILNFAAIRHIDSSWLGEIVESYKVSASNGGILTLAGISPQLRSLLRTTTLSSILKSYDTEQEAIASFGGTALPEPGRTVFSAGSLWAPSSSEPPRR